MNAASRMDLGVRDAAGAVVVIDVAGFLDASTVARLDETIKKLVAEGRSRILINFAELQYISSSGVGLFMGSLSEIRASNGELKLASMPAKVRKVFDLLGFSELVSIFDSEALALEDFAGPPAEADAEPAFPMQVSCGGCGTGYSAPKVGM